MSILKDLILVHEGDRLDEPWWMDGSSSTQVINGRSVHLLSLSSSMVASKRKGTSTQLSECRTSADS